jgi:hypothetical protein
MSNVRRRKSAAAHRNEYKMNKYKQPALFAAPLVALLLGCTTASDNGRPSVTRAALQGCWTNSESRAFREDGSTSLQTGMTSVFYTEDRLYLTSIGPNPRQLSSMEYEYSVAPDGGYSQRMLASSHPSHTAQYRRPHQVRIAGDQLTTEIYPVMPSSVSGRTVTKIVTSFRRSKSTAQDCLPSKSDASFRFVTERD